MSNNTSNCETIQQQLAAYALGERDIDGEVQAHLDDCPACRDDLLAYAQVARVLPYSAPDVAPSPALRERIIADASMPAVVDRPAPRIVRPAPTRRPRGLSPSWMGLACAMIALIASLGWNVSQQRTITAQTAQLTTSREGWQTTIVLLNDPSVKWFALSGDQARGHVWTTPGGKVGCLVVQGLPTVADDQVYQVWLTHNGWSTSAGTFQGRNGNAWTLIRTEDALDTFTDITVTVEPRGGGTTPGDQNVLRGTFSAATEMDPLARHTWLYTLVQETPQGS